MKIARKILLNPGPVTTTAGVKSALFVNDICHREQEFINLLKPICAGLKDIINADDSYACILFSASGTGAIEAAISSSIPYSQKIAIINNGTYGERLLEIAKSHKINTCEIYCSPYEPLDLNQIEKILQQDNGIFALAVVHHETSTGQLNPVEELSLLCKRYNKFIIVDAMSSFAGIAIDFKEIAFDCIIASSNKCLQGMPGVAFVICNKEFLAACEKNTRTCYFDLYKQYKSLVLEEGGLRFTAPVQIMYALQQAIVEFFKETAKLRISRYNENYTILAEGLIKLGFDFLVPEKNQSRLLALVQYPLQRKILKFNFIHDYLYERGYTIYPAKLPIENAMRIACIGDIYPADMRNFLSFLHEALESC